MTRIEVLALVGVPIVGAIVLIPLLGGGASAEARRTACLANLGVLGQAMGGYLEDHDDRWPFIEKLPGAPIHDPPWESLADVLKPYLADPGALRCPADARTLAPDDPRTGRFGTKTTWHETEGASYEWQFADAYGGARVGEEPVSKLSAFGRLGRADQPMATDFDTFHPETEKHGSFNSLYADLKARPSRGSGPKRR